jgi:hypothetical protein
MKLNQLSVFLENKPGALSAPCRLLAQAGLNIQTFSLADTQQFGILRVMVHDWAQGKQILEKHGYVVKITEVVALEVPDRAGGLADLLEIVERAKVNVEYMYAFTVKQEGKGLLAFRFSDPDAAIKALQREKINVIGNLDLVKRLGD